MISSLSAGGPSAEESAELEPRAEAAPDATVAPCAPGPDASAASGQGAAQAARLSDKANGSAMPAPASEDAAVGKLRQAVLAHLHLHAYEFCLADCGDGECVPQRCWQRHADFCMIYTRDVSCDL